MTAKGFVDGGAIARSVPEVLREAVPGECDGYEVVRLVAIGVHRNVNHSKTTLRVKHEWYLLGRASLDTFVI